MEGLGLSVMEAQVFGLPVVASRVGGIPTLIEDGKTGLLVESEKPQALAEALIKVLSDPAKAKGMGAAAREFISREHSSSRMADETAALYNKVLVKQK